MKKRLLSMLMVVLMVFALLPAAAFAADECDHVWQTVDIKMDAQAKTSGVKAEVCEKCGKVNTSSIVITPFTASKDQCDVCTTPEKFMVQEAACGVVGLEVYYCATCGKDMGLASKAKGYPALKHDFTYTVVEDPTCLHEGWGYAVCSICKEPFIIGGAADAKDLGANKATIAKYAQKDHDFQLIKADIDRDGDGFITPYCDGGWDLKARVKAVHPETVEGWTKYVTTGENVAWGSVDSYYNADGSNTTEVVEAQNVEYYFESGNGIGYTGDKTCTLCGYVIDEANYGHWTADLSHNKNHVASMKLLKEGYLPGIDPETGLKYDGKTDYYYCGYCDKYFGGTTIDFFKYYNINAAADTVTVGAYAATCTHPGYTGDVMTQIDKLDEDGNPVKDENGNTVQVYILKHKGEVIDQLDHTWGPLKDVEPTCYTSGVKYSGGKQCTVCGARDWDATIVVRPNHDTNATKAWMTLVEATCKNRGIDAAYCTVCGEFFGAHYNNPVDHVATVVGAKDATCTEAGYTGDKVCKWCGEDLGKGEEIAPTGHKSEIQGAKDATETEDGYTGDEVCTICGEVLKKGEVIPKTGEDKKDDEKKDEDKKDDEQKTDDKVIDFVDVADNAYYADAVKWAAGKEITKGTDATHFSPNAACTRAQMVTFLYRAAGSPKVEDVENPFTDVKAGEYYYDAVLWAVKTGVTKGTSATTFSPNATVTRAQVVTFLFRYDGSKSASAANPFNDVNEGAYYYDAVIWAVENEITTGTSATTFAPNSDCTRAQIVTFLYRFFVK